MEMADRHRKNPMLDINNIKQNTFIELYLTYEKGDIEK